MTSSAVTPAQAHAGCPGQPRPPLQPGQVPPPLCGRGSQTRDGIAVHGSTMEDFCLALSGMPLRLDRRKIVDKTGVTGQFDFDLKFPPDDAGLDGELGARHALDPVADLERLQGALRGAGLQLVQSKASYEFLVIDHVERPSAN